MRARGEADNAGETRGDRVENIGKMMQGDPLVKLVQPANFVGWIYAIDYERAFVMTNDLWKARAFGVPLNCFLVAAAFAPERLHEVPLAEREVLLLRVIGSAKLPQEDDLVRTKIDHFQGQQGATFSSGGRDFDDLTRNQVQFGGMECRVLGTFFMRDGELCLGTDLESFASAARLTAYRPRRDALTAIVNHVDPVRRRKAADDLRQLGIAVPIPPLKIGTLRYTSTDRLHRSCVEELVPVTVEPSDFLARRTAVFGMTRTGKSNLVKQTIAVVQDIATRSRVQIGQVIYDVNGEYANANQQDQGAIADVFPEATVRYRMLQTRGFRELQNNFYRQLNEGLATIRDVLAEEGTSLSQDVKVFLDTSFDRPSTADRGERERWRVRIAAYSALLFRADFQPPSPDFKVRFRANMTVRAAVQAVARSAQAQPAPVPVPAPARARTAGPQNPQNAAPSQVDASDDSTMPPGALPDWATKDPAEGLTLAEATEWFLAARIANQRQKLLSTSGNDWLENSVVAMLNMLANKSSSDAYINGYKVLTAARGYHSPRRSEEVGKEVYELLEQGKIVILDLSVGNAALRKKISEQIATTIFQRSMQRFISGQTPPNVVVYVEEAHNLIGKGMALTDTWPRLAKEGAKYRIALVYATQEVSSVHPNILANTENWFVSHLNNESEIKELAHFYDFGDFSRSLLRAQDVGFTRVKTLSSPFVIPVQVDKFDPQAPQSGLSEPMGVAVTDAGSVTAVVRPDGRPAATVERQLAQAQVAPRQPMARQRPDALAPGTATPATSVRSSSLWAPSTEGEDDSLDLMVMDAGDD